MAGTKHFLKFLLPEWPFSDCGSIRVGALGCACRHPAPWGHGMGSGAVLGRQAGLGAGCWVLSSEPKCFPQNLNVFADKLYLSYLLIVYLHIKKKSTGL